MKRCLCLALLLALLLGCVTFSAVADAQLRGWQKKGGYQYVSLGSYPYEEDGTPRPVLWDVLSVEDGKALLLTHYVIDAHQVVECFDTKAIDNKEFRHISDYADADLIGYMNGTMLETMFGDDPMVGALVEEEYGRLYMLTSPQYRIADYGFTTAYTQKSTTRVVEGTPYLFTVQQFEGANRVSHQAGLKGVTYWAIAIKPERDWMQIVGGDGHMSWAGYCRTNVGIRAALTLDLSQCELDGGSGTKDSPYTLRYTGTALAAAPEITTAPAPAEDPADAEDEGILLDEEDYDEEVCCDDDEAEDEEADDAEAAVIAVPVATPVPAVETVAPQPAPTAQATQTAAPATEAQPAPTAVTVETSAYDFPNLLMDIMSLTAAPASSVAATPAPAVTAAPAANAAPLATEAPTVEQEEQAQEADDTLLAEEDDAPTLAAEVIPAAESAATVSSDGGEWGRGLFSFIGDCSIGDATQSRSRKTSLTNVIAENGMDYPFSTAQDYFQTDDGTFANLEVCLTTQAKLKSTRVFNLLAPPEYAQCLVEGGVDVVNTVNNHAFDFKNAGYVDTMNALDAAGVNHFGTIRPGQANGSDILTTHEANGIKIGFVGFSYPQNSDIKRIQDRVAQLRADGCNFVVVSLHWGRETHLTPNAGQFPYAKQVIDAGADMVWGHHPHVLQPIYFYKGKPILFSTGNFIFGTMGNADRSSGIFQLEISLNDAGEGHVDSIHVVPMRTNPSPTYVPDILTEEKDMQACWKKLIGKKEQSGCVPLPAAFEQSGTVYIDADGNLSCP